MSVEQRLDEIERLLRELLEQRRPRFAESQFLSKYAVARRLGIRTADVDRLIQEGHLRPLPHGEGKRDQIPAIQLAKFSVTGIPPPNIAGKRPPKARTKAGPPRSLEEELRAARAIKIPRDP